MKREIKTKKKYSNGTKKVNKKINNCLKSARKQFQLIKKIIASFILIVIQNKSISLFIFAIIMILFLGWQINRSVIRLLQGPEKDVQGLAVEERPPLRFFSEDKEWRARTEESKRKMMEKVEEQPFFKLFELVERIERDYAIYIEENPELKAKFQEIDQRYGKRFQELKRRVAGQEIGIEEIIEEQKILFEDWYRALKNFIKLVGEHKARYLNDP